jgi:hypothetical protein
MLQAIVAVLAGADLSDLGRRVLLAMIEHGLAYDHSLAVAMLADHGLTCLKEWPARGNEIASRGLYGWGVYCTLPQIKVKSHYTT